MTHAFTPDGFNLLPYRARRRRELRRLRLAVLAAAGLTGCAAVGAVAGWDALRRVQVDERRTALEASLGTARAQIDEHARLERVQAERRRARETAVALAAPRERFLTLLDALADTPQQGGVALQRVSQRADEVELAALAPDSQSAARWLKRLEDVRGVESVEVIEMKRRGEAPSSKREPQTDRYEFTALVRYAASVSSAKAASGVARISKEKRS